jgi:saccharopine dehydrogenase-like NADP-dependent oxidoreductase
VDVTVLRVIAEGRKEGRAVRWTWDLVDRYDPETRLRSMSRTTAFPATIVAGLLLDGRFSRPGMHPPEVLARQDGIVDLVLAGLEARGVHVTFRED